MHQMKLIAGVDEVGRGSLAGDVVAAAVVLGPDHGIEGLVDSKTLSEKKRSKLFFDILDKALDISVGRANLREIAELNILHASMLAMKRAVMNLKVRPEMVYVDGNQLPDWSYTSEAVVQGDAKIEEISAASIIAKVTRDREMLVADKHYPQYGFAQNKGYPTKAHLDAIQLHGVTPLHRIGYAPVAKFLNK